MLHRGTRKAKHHRVEPDPLARTVGQRVRRLRLERGFVFDAIVEEAGLGRGYISELERGMVVPTVGALAKVASALEVTVADLVLGDTPREQLFELLRDADDADVERPLAEFRRPAQPVAVAPGPRARAKRTSGVRARRSR